MATKKTQVDRAIEALEAKQLNIQAAIDELRAQQSRAAAKKTKRTRKVEDRFGGSPTAAASV